MFTEHTYTDLYVERDREISFTKVLENNKYRVNYNIVE